MKYVIILMFLTGCASIERQLANMSPQSRRAMYNQAQQLQQGPQYQEQQQTNCRTTPIYDIYGKFLFYRTTCN